MNRPERNPPLALWVEILFGMGNIFLRVGLYFALSLLIGIMLDNVIFPENVAEMWKYLKRPLMRFCPYGDAAGLFPPQNQTKE